MNGRVLVFVPAYNCERQVPRVLAQLEAGWTLSSIEQVIVVDNGSSDRTREVVAEHIRGRGDGRFKLLLNDANYGLGGSHKVAFQYALREGFDWLVVLHGDDQGTIADFREVIERAQNSDVDAYLGSRFMRGSNTPGYSRFRIFGNFVFNSIYSMCLGKAVHDLGAGLNFYRMASVRIPEVLKYPDNLTFNCVMLCSQIIRGSKLEFVPITWREDDQVSNVKLFRQSFQTLGIALSALFRRRKFPEAEYRQVPVVGYSWRVADV